MADPHFRYKRAKYSLWFGANHEGLGLLDSEYDEDNNRFQPTHETLDHLQLHHRVLEPLTG